MIVDILVKYKNMDLAFRCLNPNIQFYSNNIYFDGIMFDKFIDHIVFRRKEISRFEAKQCQP